MSWIAIVPLNLGGERKTRLSPGFSADQRERLADAMARHVIACLRQTPGIARLAVLSPERPAYVDVEWRRDLGRGLNDELAAVLHDEKGDVLIIHGDLPLLTPDDVAALLSAARDSGIAIAPDRSGAGTNAVALSAGWRLPPAFGAGSFERHRRGARGAPAIVSRVGVSLDVDTGADFEAAIAAGWRYSTL